MRRRQFLIDGLTLCTGLIALPSVSSAFDTKQNDAILSAIKIGDRFALCKLENNSPPQLLELPGRAHQVLFNPNKSMVVAVARRPQTYLTIADAYSLEKLVQIESPKNTHFFGHACFSRDGNLLFTTEQNFETGEGLIGIRDVRDEFRLLQHHASHGIGPHELATLHKLDYLVVANGGIRTHPNTGRKKLNIDSMHPNLSYIDVASGELIEQRSLSRKHHQLSIRHIDVNKQDVVVFGSQQQGRIHTQGSCIGKTQLGEELRLATQLPDKQANTSNYVGSIRFESSGRYFAASDPRAGLISFWDSETMTLVNQLRSHDVCGISPSNLAFVTSSGAGKINGYSLNQSTGKFVKQWSELIQDKGSLISFDNHLS
ncbi:hypothetical protein A3715_06625 [Oleiphilus sp. HI0009]|uniref:DUF1513 domain-containing protein n=3 Tax=Oleiphilus TaxID=141450 RepID=UPI0007C285BB|nr:MULTISPECIES: DUF1513 domain-containing protein [unclassified Oleiphilus]KZX81672.1 hypothetical protein A3715_06625 [Oleiphilus sp. HI0009]KZY69582.1 hypothetical protein A3739_08540 [Oleiphilus sp. HI0067]KZY70437.1 hypothetical protein A3738_15235 [Oleiphilus sp. HI0066]KZZ62245.1 hypothetical protein A3762_13510 [Oleiphilus sp. HI0125]